MGPGETLPLAWLRPTLDRCRNIIELGVHEIRDKPSEQGDRQVVTDIDLAVERELVGAIRATVPSAAIISEEGQHDPRGLDESETCFVIDPIDGTDELVAGRPGFAVSVAEYRLGSPVAAVLDFPRIGARFEVGVGQGTWRDGERVHLQESRGLDGVRVAVSATQLRDAALRPVWETLAMVELVPTPGFTAKFGTMLGGECAAAVHLPVDERATHLWDYAAAGTLLTEAGGVFTSWAGEDLLRERPLVHIGGWIAAVDAPLAARLRAVLLPVIDRLQRSRNA